MEKDFLELMCESYLDSDANVSVTENGALGFRTTGSKLLDLNFAVSSLRNDTEYEIIGRFMSAYNENPRLAIAWLFFARDIRGGMGERRLFRVCMTWIADTYPNIAKKLLPLVAEYGRWDDLIILYDTEVKKDVEDIIIRQLTEDLRNLKEDKPVSLLAKWMPSINTSSPKTKAVAKQMREMLDISPKEYRKMLSALRNKIDIVERKMSRRQWNEISYPAVPSRANLIYMEAFLKHDFDRRLEYIGKLKSGEEKINAETLFPHDIVCKARDVEDKTLEALWNALPNTIADGESTIVVADGSGSMFTHIAGSVQAIDVANALAIYFSEHLTGPFKDKYITFSHNPRFVNLSQAKTLHQKIKIAENYDEVSDTNIEGVFDLILKTAIDNNLKQSDLPKNILIISDMEFNYCSVGNQYGTLNSRLFDEISKRYEEKGYKLPRLVFWNVCSRTGTIPLIQNDLGVALVSGFSPSIANMVMSNELDPLKALIETITSKRYQPVLEALNN